MDKDISEITDKWKCMSQTHIDADVKIGPYLEKYFVKYKETLYNSALSLFYALDNRSLRKSHKHEPISIQALKCFKDFVDRNQEMMDEAFWEQKVILAACQFAINRENETWISTICKYYHVESLPKADRMRLLEKTINEKKFSSAAWFGIYANVILEFNIEDICVPLICQTRISVLEQLMKHDPAIAQDVVVCIDKYIDNAEALAFFARDIPGANFVMLNDKAINKFAKRLARDYKIPIRLCPKIDSNAKMTAIKFLFKRRYEEPKPIDKRTWQTMLDSVFDLDNPAFEDSSVVFQLISDLTTYEQYEEARRVAHLHRIPENEWPESLLNNRSKPDKPLSSQTILDWNPEPVIVEPEKYEIDLPDDKIFFINNHEQFKSMNSYITDRHPLLAIDTEWKPQLGLLSESKAKAALVQIACEDRIFVIDTVELCCDSEWITFVNSIINNPKLIKIGYSIQNDIRAISELVSDLNIETKPEGFIDYADFHNALVQSFKIPLPAHPVTSGGLSKLVYSVLGKHLVKDDQYTNWEMRPLTTAKIVYAATDAYVLLEIHEKLESWCQERGFNFEVLMHEFLDKHSKRNRDVSVRDAREELTNLCFQPTTLQDFKVVVDPIASSFGVLLRYLGVDVVVPVFNSADTITQIASTDKRPYITIGTTDESIVDTLPHGWTFAIDNMLPPFERLTSVAIKFNLIMTDKSIFTRCCRCNYHHLIVIDKSSIELWKENGHRLRDDVDIAYHLLPENDNIKVFYICYSCGMVYWKNKYYKLIRQWVKALMLNFNLFNHNPNLNPQIEKSQDV